MSTHLTELFAELSAVPRLEGALCRGHSALFDPADTDDDKDDTKSRLRFAIKTCHWCPALSECRSWLNSLPRRQRPRGVVAGRIT